MRTLMISLGSKGLLGYFFHGEIHLMNLPDIQQSCRCNNGSNIIMFYITCDQSKGRMSAGNPWNNAFGYTQSLHHHSGMEGASPPVGKQCEFMGIHALVDGNNP